VEPNVVVSLDLDIQSPPPDWLHFKDVTLPKGTKFFNELVTQQINVVKIKKILDGLHE